MAKMNTVTEVSIKKKGERNGRPWTCYAIKLDDGRVASGFEVIHVGDKVAVKPNDKNPDFLDYRLCEGVDGPVNAPETPPAPLTARDEYWQRKLALEVARGPEIRRMHSQQMAFEVLKLKVSLNELLCDDLTPAKLRQLADYFDQDVKGAR